MVIRKSGRPAPAAAARSCCTTATRPALSVGRPPLSGVPGYLSFWWGEGGVRLSTGEGCCCLLLLVPCAPSPPPWNRPNHLTTNQSHKIHPPKMTHSQSKSTPSKPYCCVKASTEATNWARVVGDATMSPQMARVGPGSLHKGGGVQRVVARDPRGVCNPRSISMLIGRLADWLIESRT